jgi:hypothetical protein
MWLKELDVIVHIPRGKQNFAQWSQKCHELHTSWVLVRSLP